MKITLEEQDLLSLISGYLKSAGFHSTLAALEEETGHRHWSYGRDVQFVRDLIVKGRWDDVRRFLEPMKRSSFDYDSSLFEVDKQVFLEALHAQTTPLPEQQSPVSSETLVEILKGLEGRCTQQEFHGLCFCLTVSSLSQHPDYKNWTVHTGRYELFERLLPKLESIFPDQCHRRGRSANMPDGHIVKICQLAVQQQLSDWRYHNPNARVPEEFEANLMGDDFKFRSLDSSAIGRGRVGQSMPTMEWRLDTVEERKKPAVFEEPVAEAKSDVLKSSGKVVEEAQGFYSLQEGEEQPVNERFDPPMEVSHFPPHQSIEKRPPVAWEIKLNDEETEDKDEDKAEGGNRKESDVNHAAAKEDDGIPDDLSYPPINPDDPYGHMNTAQSFKSFSPTASLLESHPIRTVSWAPDGETFCVGTNSKALRLCKLTDHESNIEVIHERTNHHHGSVYASSWNCTGNLVATGSNDKTVKVVKVFAEDTGGIGAVANSMEQDDTVLKRHQGTVRDVTFHGDDPGRLLSVGAGDNSGMVWDIIGVKGEEPSPIAVLKGHESTVFTGKFSPFETHFVATGSQDNTVKLWDLRTNTEGNGASLNVRVTCPILSLVYGGKHEIVTSHSDGSLRTLDVRTGKSLSVIQAHQDECRSLDMTACGRFLISGGFDGTAGIYKMGSGGDTPEFVAGLMTQGGGRILSARWRNRGIASLLMAGANCSVTYWKGND